MITHVVLMRFDDPADVDEAVRLVRAFPDQIPVIRSLVVGSTAVTTPNSYDFGLVMEFDNEADLQTYQHHPAHEAAATWFRAQRSAVSSIDLVS